MEVDPWCEDFDFGFQSPGAMRKGHRRRLAKEGDKESERGRSRYSQSVGKVKHRFEERWRLRKAVALRFEPEDVLVLEGMDALAWESIDCNALAAWYEEDCWAEDEVDVKSFSSCEATSDTELSLASWSILSTACGLSDEEASTQASVQVAVRKRPCARWAEAEAAAARGAEEYRIQTNKRWLQEKAVRRPPQVKAAPTPAPAPTGLSIAPRFNTPPAYAGHPQDSLRDLHDAALKFAEGRSSYGRRHADEVVHENTEEFKAVTSYFTSTLSADCEVQQLRRLHNQKVLNRIHRGGGETLMFHGCRTAANEAKILQDGFQVSSCCSGGKGYGTWFAYNAKYSNCGYALRASNGVAHMFICVVSYHYTVLDNMEMRVVGQNCAFPQWLIQYKTTYPLSFPPRRAGTRSPGQQRVWHVVRDGRWVRESVGT